MPHVSDICSDKLNDLFNEIAQVSGSTWLMIAAAIGIGLYFFFKK